MSFGNYLLFFLFIIINPPFKNVSCFLYLLSLVTVFLTAEVDNGTSEDRYGRLLLRSQLWEVGGRELARRKEAWDTVFFAVSISLGERAAEEWVG